MQSLHWTANRLQRDKLMPLTTFNDRSAQRKPFIRDDLAYVIPMAAFLLMTRAANWWPSLYAVAYGVKTAVVAILLVVLWPHYTKIRWKFWWLGAISYTHLRAHETGRN